MAIEPPAVPRDVTLFSFLEAAQRVHKRIAHGLHSIGLSPIEYDVLARLRMQMEVVRAMFAAAFAGSERSEIGELLTRILPATR